MGKKRQLDFQKTQLKPGRPVGKRKNITSTGFKSKKIMIHNKTLKEASEETIPDVLKKIKSSTGQNKVTNLMKLNALIHKQKKSLNLHLSQIFDTVYKIVLETDDNVRSAGIQVFITLLRAASDVQIKSYMPLLVSTLHCAMTTSNNRTKTSSLALLDCMLKEHPDFVCSSMTLLNDLLQMVIDHPRKLSHSKFVPIAPVADETVYSRTTYEVNVLGYINAFLKKMLKDKVFPTEEDRDEQEVYWNCKEPLYLEIYAGGGLKPVDIEKLNLDDLDFQDASFDDIEVVQPFLESMLSELLKIFSQEIPSDYKSDDKIFKKETILNLNIVFQVLSHISDWAELLSFEAMDNEIKKFLLKKVLGRFPFESGHQFGTSATQFSECVQLNLEVCYLLAKFLVQSGEDNDIYNDEIFGYVKRILGGKNEKGMQQEIKLMSVPMIIKIMKIYFSMSESPEVSDFLQHVLTQLCSLLKTQGQDIRPEKQLLISFFTKISLEPGYQFLTKSDAMKAWYTWLFKALKEAKNDKIDVKLLKAIKKIANRNYPCFDQILSSLDFSVIKSLLRNSRFEVRDTAIFLIYNMEDIPGSMLENIARIILLDSSFPKRCALRLIRLLTCRFVEKPKLLEDGKYEIKEFSVYNAQGTVDFTLFLLNIAFDSYNLNNEKLVNFEANKYTKALKPLEASHAFSIFPSLKWKEHSELFEVCAKALKQLPPQNVNNTVTEVVKEILNNTTTLPMHCALAILKLHNFDIDDKYYRLLMSDFTFSCLLTLSVLTHMPIEEEWHRWNVEELMGSIELNRMTAVQTVQLIDDGRFGKPEGIFVFHVLRILKFLAARQLLEARDARSLMNTLDCLKVKCFDKRIAEQPLYHKLFTHFYLLYQSRQ